MNSGLRWAGLEVRRKPDQLIHSSHEISMTFEFVAAHFACRNPNRDVTLVEIGAYDGVENDPVVEALELHGWSGVLVEPQRTPFEALQRRCKANPKLRAFNVAIADQDGSRTLYRVEPSLHLPSWTQQIASFDKSHVMNAEKALPKGVEVEPLIVEESVECWTFDTLLRQAEIEHVDVLQVDAEGYDLELLRLFDIPRRLPSIVNYEHVTLSREGRNAAADLLIANGYRLAMSHYDTVAYRC
jgi:FkbM family methyltransferase